MITVTQTCDRCGTERVLDPEGTPKTNLDGWREVPMLGAKGDVKKTFCPHCLRWLALWFETARYDKEA